MKTKKDLKTSKTESELDTIFKETIGKWSQLSGMIQSELYDLTVLLKEFQPDTMESCSVTLNILLREIEGIHNKAEKLEGSIRGASIMKPIDELETTVIEAMRAIRFSLRNEGEGKLRNVLIPLFELAEERVEGYSFPEWVRRSLNYRELMQEQESHEGIH